MSRFRETCSCGAECSNDLTSAPFESFRRAHEACRGGVSKAGEASAAVIAALDKRWRFAEANVLMLRDALVEFHEFVQLNLDTADGPHSVTDYLTWDRDRAAALNEFLAPARTGA